MLDVLNEVTRSMWLTLFPGLLLQPEVDPDPAPAPDDHVVACIRFSEGWEGRLLLRCSQGLADRLTGVVLRLEADAIRREATLDLMGELANVIGGNLGPALPGRPQLSLPEVLEEPLPDPGDATRHVLAYRVDGEAFVVELRSA